MARPSLMVRGVDLLGPVLAEPGWIILTDFPPGSTDNLDVKAQVTQALQLPEMFAVSLHQWEDNVRLHSTPQSAPFHCARIPIILSLSPPSPEERFRISAVSYNPDVFCGEQGTLTLFEALGLSARLGTTAPIHGLELKAHNPAGLIAAAEWMIPGSEEGEGCVADRGFESFAALATEPAHTARDIPEPGEFKGRMVQCGEVEMECVKHEGERVRLRKPDGKTIWRKVSEIQAI